MERNPEKISADVYIDDKACWPWMTKQEWGTVSGRLEKEDKKMKTVDMELILLCALMAAIGAFGLVTGVVLLFGIQFQECNAALLTGIGVRALGHIMGKPADTEPEPGVEKRLNIVQRAGKWLYLG